ncbi:PstS family phosphate ABC transporter substrate-binding protein [Steroidobacter sp.]|uniref:PstS family phosphate ABC transporter substrate-binding protein n=1 Tax=Steroidobacter sp. TaxID=1978227 RepID=UPI0025F8A9F9|nr:substrate-binding domain-containing protein [Steroidobacter sp.]
MSLLSSVAAAAEFEPVKFDLSALPAYEPQQPAIGTLRLHGTPVDDLVGLLAREFKSKQKQVRLDTYLINTSQALAGLVTGIADVGIMGHRAWHTSLVAFERTYGYPVTEIKFAKGSYNDPRGSSPGVVFFVHKSNPLSGLTLEQIDGIFGTQRTGAWQGTKWSSAAARGPEKNIRTWGQLGLTGKWADTPIRLYGTDVTLSNWAKLIEQVAFQGSTKWNPALNENPRADISFRARDQEIVQGVQDDPSAIGFMFQRVVDAHGPDLKVLPIAADSAAKFVVPSAQSFFDGSYPFSNGVYLYVNRKPGESLPSNEKEFLRFVLSQDGQRVIADNRLFIPLSAAEAQAELRKLD